MSELFKIVTFQNGKYIANKEELFDACRYLDPQNRGQKNMVSDVANSSLNCFFRNAKEAFDSNLPFQIGAESIDNPKELSEWLSKFGSDSFKEEITSRFKAIFPDSDER